MPPKKIAKRKAKAKAKVGSKKRRRAEENDEEALPQLDDAQLEEAIMEDIPLEEPAAPSKERAADEDDAPLISMMPASIAPKEAEEGLPSFAAAAKESKRKEDDDDQPLITGATLGKRPGGDEAEGDVWQQLEKELQAPLHAAPEDGNAQNSSFLPNLEADSDDDWGVQWKGAQKKSQTELPAVADVLDEIAKAAASDSKDWHKEQWVQKEELPYHDEDEEEPAWGEGHAITQKDKKDREDEWIPDEEWPSGDAFSNSKEAMAVENLVRKIRARANKERMQESGMEDYPSDTMLQVLKNWVKKPLPEQRVLLAVVLFLEAMTLDVEQPMPDLNSVGLSMLTTQDLVEVRRACEVAPPHLMLRKADSKIPDAKLRKETVPKMISELKTKLCSLLAAGSDVRIEEDELGKNVDNLFVEQPSTAKIMGLVHCCEYVAVVRQVWDKDTDLFNSLAKQVDKPRVFQVLCRLDIRDACRLGMQTLDVDLEPLRKSKSACLNRLASEWKLAPREEDMMLLHMLHLERQIQVLMSIERDIELKWCDLMAKVDGRDVRSAKLREYLDFPQRLRPYINDEDLLQKGRRPIEAESGRRLAINELAMVRQGVSDILKRLKKVYKWKPDMNSRKAISKTNWVARLSAVLKLVNTTYTLSADKELRKFLHVEAARTLGNEIYKTYTQWKKAEQGDGLQIPRKKIASPDMLEDRSKQWEDFLMKVFPEREMPRNLPPTPGGGMASMTPGLGAAMTPGLAAAMTPGLAAAMTPGLNPGTPGLSGAVTPGYRAPTPTGAWPPPGYTPGYRETGLSTPQWRPPPATPLGPVAGTPGRVNSQTPFGQPPPTPVGVKLDAPPATPAGVPPPTPTGPAGPRAQAQPMTPPRETKVKDSDVKAE